MIGTRDHFRSWLAGQGYTYTAYTKLAIEAKDKLYRQYRSGRTP